MTTHRRAVRADDVPLGTAALGGVRRQDLETGLRQVIPVLDVLRGVGKMVFAADDVRNLHLDVVDHIHEMKNP